MADTGKIIALIKAIGGSGGGSSGGITDVKLGNNTSLVENGVATIRLKQYGGLKNDNGSIAIDLATQNNIKGGTATYTPIAPQYQHNAAFYGLAKAAGEDMSSSNNAVGTYTSAAKAAIQTMLGVNNMLAPVESDSTSDAPYAIGDKFAYNGKLYKATAAISIGDTITPGTNCTETNISDELLDDVKVAGTSVVSGGVANIPLAGSTNPGVVKIPDMGNTNSGILINNNGEITTYTAASSVIKAGSNQYRPIAPYYQHIAVFYGLAKAAGEDMALSDNAVGTYTAAAKAAIQSMLGIESGVSFVETVSGTTPSITGEANVRYICGEVSTISITPPPVGTIVVRFESGSTAAVLTLPGTVIFPSGVDLTTLETDTIYEIMITDGVYGGVMTWAVSGT